MRVVRSAQRADDDPVAVHHPGGPRPPAGQPDAVARRHAAARRRQGSGREERTRRERLLLGVLVEQRQHPVVQRVEADRPRAGRASVRHPADGVEDRREIGLHAAVAGGHEQLGEAATRRGRRRWRAAAGAAARRPARARPVGRRTPELMVDAVADTAGMAETVPYLLVWKLSRARQGVSMMSRKRSGRRRRERWAAGRRGAGSRCRRRTWRWRAGRRPRASNP